MTTFEAVVFDLDGVLVDSITTIRAAFGHAYARAGGTGPAPFGDYRAHLGRSMPETLRLMGLPAPMYGFFVEESRRLTREIRAYPGVPPLLDRLRGAGTRLAVATGRPVHRAAQVLDAAGLRAYFAAVVGSDEVASGKPAPDIVVLALGRLGATPDRTLTVGDSPLDLRSGRAAGTRTAAAFWGEGDRADLLAERPDLTADSAEVLLERLLEADRV